MINHYELKILQKLIKRKIKLFWCGWRCRGWALIKGWPSRLSSPTPTDDAHRCYWLARLPYAHKPASPSRWDYNLHAWDVVPDRVWASGSHVHVLIIKAHFSRNQGKKQPRRPSWYPFDPYINRSSLREREHILIPSSNIQYFLSSSWWELFILSVFEKREEVLKKRGSVKSFVSSLQPLWGCTKRPASRAERF